MKIGGVEFPDPLLNALRERRLVIFAGAIDTPKSPRRR